jgi:AGZA family xanthine/uracil permease-like MFS transporter
MNNFLERFFQIKQQGSSARLEILGGITTFATMAYIIVVNPAILANIPDLGHQRGALTVATLLTAVFGCLLMGLYANRPIAVAPYMGENAFLAFGLAAFAITWQQRLGTVFVAGAAFLVLTLLGIRAWLAAAISPSMKHAFAVGIGLFLLLIGLYQTGIVTSGVTGLPVQALQVKDGTIAPPPVPLKIGNVRDPQVQLALAGFAIMALLLYWQVKAAILIGIVLIGVAGYLLGHGQAPEQVFALPWASQYSLKDLALHLDIHGVFIDKDGAFRFTFMPILLTLLLISFLDTLATLVALSPDSTGDKRDGKPKDTITHDYQKPMLVDSLACMFAALVGTSTSGAYIESATGIRAGARTGLAAVVTGLLFALALFFIPLFGPLQALTYAYGPALMIVGVLMFGGVRHIEFDDLTELLPALATIVMMVFTYNIANGLTAGLVLHPLMKIACGKARALHPGGWVLGLLCLTYYVFGVPH